MLNLKSQVSSTNLALCLSVSLSHTPLLHPSNQDSATPSQVSTVGWEDVSVWRPSSVASDKSWWMIGAKETFRVVSFYLGLREEFRGSPTSAGTPHFLDSTLSHLTGSPAQNGYGTGRGGAAMGGLETKGCP